MTTERKDCHREKERRTGRRERSVSVVSRRSQSQDGDLRKSEKQLQRQRRRGNRPSRQEEGEDPPRE
jgi:hypothetical protein